MNTAAEYRITVNPIDADGVNSVVLTHNFIEDSHFLTLNIFLTLNNNTKKYVMYFVVEYSGMRQELYFDIDDVLWFRFGDKDKGLKNMYKYASDLPKNFHFRNKTAMFVVTAEILKTILEGKNVKVIVPIGGDTFIYPLTELTLKGVNEFYETHVLPIFDLYQLSDV